VFGLWSKIKPLPLVNPFVLTTSQFIGTSRFVSSYLEVTPISVKLRIMAFILAQTLHWHYHYWTFSSVRFSNI